MKRILKKLLVIILILLTLNNFLIVSAQAAEDTLADMLGKYVGSLFSGVIGWLTYIYRAPAVMAGWLINKFMAQLALGENADNPGPLTSITIFDILFDQVEILSIDFFDLSNPDSLVGKFRINIAAWFYIMRNVSAGILLVILIYIGIRMAISTVASDRAMYKRMLADWAVSLLLIFILNYIIIFTIAVNKALVGVFAEILESDEGLASAMKNFAKLGMTPWAGITSIVAAMIYIMLMWQTLSLFFSYFNRMLKIAFLIIIAPLISLTYSIDKIGDGKAQALEAWLKEFVYTILMQPFHCAIYLSLISTSINLLKGLNGFGNKLSETLGAGIMALVCINFTREAEKIVRKIFAFKDDNKSTSLVAGVAMASLAMNKAKNIGTTGSKVIHNTRDFFKDGARSLSINNVRAEIRAASQYLSNKKGKDENEEDKDYKTLRSEARADIYSKKADRMEKIENALMKNSKDSDDVKKLREMTLKAEVERLSQNNNGKMTPDELNALARINNAKKLRTLRGVRLRSKHENETKEHSQKRKNRMAKIEKFTRTAKSFIPLETMKVLGEESRKSAGFFMGAGTLGISGKVSGAAAAAIATNKAVDQLFKNSSSSYTGDVEKLLDNYNFNEPTGVSGTTDSKDELRDQKATVLSKVSSNSEDYDLDGDTTPDKLKDIIKEINDACKTIGAEPVDETLIKQTIKNSKNPAIAIAGIFSESKYKAIGDKVEKLENYGTEYAISQKFEEASKVGVSSGEITQKITEHKGTQILTEDEIKTARESNKNAQKFAIDIGNVDENDIKQITGTTEKVEPSVKQIEEFEKTATKFHIEEQERIKELCKNAKDPEIEKRFQKKMEDRQQEFERKKALLIGNAIKEINDKNKQKVQELIQKTISDVEKILNDTNVTDNNDLENLKRELELLKNS